MSPHAVHVRLGESTRSPCKALIGLCVGHQFLIGQKLTLCPKFVYKLPKISKINSVFFSLNKSVIFILTFFSSHLTPDFVVVVLSVERSQQVSPSKRKILERKHSSPALLGRSAKAHRRQLTLWLSLRNKALHTQELRTCELKVKSRP